MSNSKLINYTKLSPNYDKRVEDITKITIHHVAGNLTVEQLGESFANPSRDASSNYGIGTDGRVGLYVSENNRAWTSGNADNDHRAITIEVANDGGEPDWHVSDVALNKLIELCVDICKRNNIKELVYTGDANGNLTIHSMFEPTRCPGEYLKSKLGYIKNEVNKRLDESTDILYRVQVGAFRVKENAEKMVAEIESKGYDAFIVEVNTSTKQQNVVSPIPFESTKKSVEEIAMEIHTKDNWGRGQTRVQNLMAAGYSQAEINEIQSIIDAMYVK